ncbi:RNA exonuclease 1 homolog [Trichogramma pretiosum]|uniref:RNA exonuclease 1 homolog n=1 Tax=Trichogramma pretiosum TaxID=7493 RepID=UPI0006C9A57D|nr:RNA exonuclease 1 homolog [Trichogramma pretiosum]
MLPSTGYFKGINCPFYENGYCERPYCHFRHTRKDGATTSTAIVSESISKAQQVEKNEASPLNSANSEVLQKISEAVKKALADENLTDADSIANKVVEGLNKKLVSNVLTTSISNNDTSSIVSSSKHSKVSPPLQYTPTPIAELKKRHLPVPAYELTRESKAVKRKVSGNEKPWMDIIRNVGTAKESAPSYIPTAINPSKPINKNSTLEYIPSTKYDSYLDACETTSINDDAYVPEKIKRKDDAYYPKPKKRREEYVPRKPKVPLNIHFNDESYEDLEKITYNPELNISSAQDKSDDIMEIPLTTIEKPLDEEVITVSDDEDCNDHSNLDLLLSKVFEDEVVEKTIVKTEKVDHIVENLNDNNSDVLRFRKESIKTEKNDPLMVLEDIPNVDPKLGKIINESIKLEKDAQKTKEIDIRNTLNQKEDIEHQKNKEVDSRYSKAKDKDKNKEKERRTDKEHEEKKNKEKIKDKDDKKSREKDKHKHISRSNEKDRSSSSSRDRKRDKDSRSKESSSTSSRRRSKSEKDKRSSSKDSRDKRECKDKSNHRTEEKDKSRSKSSSTEHKSKSSSHRSSSNKSSHSHKSDKATDDLKNISAEKSSDINKCDSPEYEEFSPINDNSLFDESDSEYDVEEECRKIFQEYEVIEQPKEVKTESKPNVEEPEEIGKKRIAHASASTNIIKSVGPTQVQKRLPNPQQKMYERWRLSKEIAAKKSEEKEAHTDKVSMKMANEKTSNPGSTSHKESTVNGNNRVRIAGVPYAMLLALEKKKVMQQVTKVETKTIAQTQKGKGARVAHVPQVVPQLTRPEPIQPSGTAKFPLNVRQFYVNAMQDICVQIYDCHDDAAQRATREELTCYEKCKALNVYKNSCMLTVHRLRKEVDQKSAEPTTSAGAGMVSHEAILLGKVKGSFSVVKPKKFIVNFKGETLYNKLSKWILTDQQLKDNGFPRPHPEGPKGRAKLYSYSTRGQSNPSKVPNQRFCCRCNKPFMVDKHGIPIKKENCIYHYARKFTFRGESKYMCCKQDGSSDGCCDAPTHVWDLLDLENLRGFVKTLDKDDSAPEKQGVYALDCEMCYTTQGLELARVTVINDDCEVIYETLVKPTNPIIDYNTRFSGITEEHMENVTTTLLDVQATLLSMFSSKTILVGHSLESDFKVMKLLHDTVVDTSIMFPHKNGPPFKRALKNLCSDYLRKIIQNDVAGHDSKEDAVACMELIVWKVKEEAKLQ